ncbi:MAG: beta-Ala-His dipeptidase [Succinivibrionaceae bacterium]|nr:beta-Ala-His dipeptidase [Succinivibrionaceae bacterium]
MSNISDLCPNSVWNFFSKIAAIPHTSGNESALGEAIVKFAQARNLEYKYNQGNVFIFKDAQNSTSKDGVIFQAHIDMVGVKIQDKEFDFKKDPIEMLIEDNFVKANGTTLGADDGIGVALILAILDDKTISHPPIEAIFTIGEETDMVGANLLTKEDIHYNQLINLDSEDFGEICIGCAGGASYDIEITPDIHEVPKDYCTIKISIARGLGGHSGIDIDKNRLNCATALLTIISSLFNEGITFNLSNINSGFVRNAIPQEGYATISLPENLLPKALSTLEDAALRLKNRFKESDPNFIVNCEKIEKENIMFSEDDTLNAINLRSLNTRVIEETPDHFPVISANVGVINFENGKLNYKILSRFNRPDGFDIISEKLTSIATQNKANITLREKYPCWFTKEEGKLLKVAKESFTQNYHDNPKVTIIHAGLECGIFQTLHPSIEIISIGPTIFDVHTTKEKVDIKSVLDTYNWLLDILNKL